MNSPNNDKVFAGSVPRLYEEYFVPLIFEPYAVDMVNRVAARSPKTILEIACGTGVVTRKLASSLPQDASIIASDLNQAMLDQAIATGATRTVEWRQADAMQLPFPDTTFDAVVCQFGAMFFPDKAQAFSEARRVLRPGGAFMFSVWDRLEENEIVTVISAVLESIFPDDPPRFMSRTPHGYYDLDAISQDLKNGGFPSPPQFSTVAARSKAPSARHAAIAYCQGTPLRGEIEARNATGLAEVTDIVEKALVERFGGGTIDAAIQAHVFIVER
jgi:SAM-dependent methyltransferase